MLIFHPELARNPLVQIVVQVPESEPGASGTTGAASGNEAFGDDAQDDDLCAQGTSEVTMAGWQRSYYIHCDQLLQRCGAVLDYSAFE